MTDQTDVDNLAEFNDRVESYFNTGKPREPAGRLILDLMRALRNSQSEVVRSHAGNDALRADNARLRALLKTAKVDVATDDSLKD